MIRIEASLAGKASRCGTDASRQNGESKLTAIFSKLPNPRRSIAARRSSGSSGAKRTDRRCRTPSGTVTTACEQLSTPPSFVATRTPVRGYLDRTDLGAQPDRHSTRQRLGQAPIAADGDVPEKIAVVLRLVPQPAKRLTLRRIRSLGCDRLPQEQPGAPSLSLVQPAPGNEVVDSLRRRRRRPKSLAAAHHAPPGNLSCISISAPSSASDNRRPSDES